MIAPDNGAPGPRPLWRRALRLLALLLLVPYFLVDALFASALRPLFRWLGRQRFVAGIARWLAGLGPYPTLALFLVPVIVLEPVKPIGFWLMATGHFWGGVLFIAVGEVIKIVTVEQLFHFSQAKLLTIPLFARVYWFVMFWLDRLRALPPWQAAMRLYAALKAEIRRLWLSLRAALDLA